jgi:hypothetical protein
MRVLLIGAIVLSASFVAATTRAECDASGCSGADACDNGVDAACGRPDASELQMAPPEEKDPGSCSCLWYDHDKSASAAVGFAAVMAFALRRGTRRRPA